MPLSMTPRYTQVSPRSTAFPSTLKLAPPSGSIESPVAVTTTSASSSRPEDNRIPRGVKVSMVSVTIDALPVFSVRKKSALGAKHTRWSQGLYRGVKLSRTVCPSPRMAVACLRNIFLASSGRRLHSW